MKKTLLYAGAAILALAGMFTYFRWSSAIRQPLQFSHAQHVRQKIDCATCHKQGELDSLPATAVCSTCHAGRAFPANTQWVRVYRVAPDIIFSHKEHLQEPCATCHLSLVDGQKWIHESRFTMDFCMKCHEQKHADNSCRACHTNR